MGGYVSAKLKSEEWGSKVVTQLSEYIRSKRPDIKGYSRRNIYNLVMFYDEYSSDNFTMIVEKYLSPEFVQTASAQIQISENQQCNDVITIGFLETYPNAPRFFKDTLYVDFLGYQLNIVNLN